MKKEDVLKFLAEADDATKKELADKIGIRPAPAADPAKELAEHEAKIKKLAEDRDAAVKKLSDEKDGLATRVVDLAEKLAATDKEIKLLRDAREIDAKNAKFQTLMLNGKACEAQRAAFMKGDMAEFAEKTSIIPLNERKGKPGADNEDAAGTKLEAQGKLRDKAYELMEKNKGMSFQEAYPIAAEQNGDLKELAGY